jgi:DNA modification methylase
MPELPQSPVSAAGDSADLIFTDPTYNVDYEGYTEERLKIRGDRTSDADHKRFLHSELV